MRGQFESEMALTISSVVNKKRQCVHGYVYKSISELPDYTFNNLWLEQIFAQIALYAA